MKIFLVFHACLCVEISRSVVAALFERFNCIFTVLGDHGCIYKSIKV